MMRSREPSSQQQRALRRRLSLRDEFTLAMLPTGTVLIVFAFIEVLSEQRLLFTSLASSAFLIYSDPHHGMNSARTLLLAQTLAAGLGFLTDILFGPGYFAGGVAMIATITLMILLDAMHPPAISTSLSFAFRTAGVSNVLLFGLALGVTVALLGLERSAVWLLARYEGSP